MASPLLAQNIIDEPEPDNDSKLEIESESPADAPDWWEKLENQPFAVQEREHTLDKKLQVGFGLGTVLNSTYQNVFFYQMSLGFYWHEKWGIEYGFINYSNANSSEVDDIRLISGVPFIERARRSHGLYLMYAPVYGKVDAFGGLQHIRIYGGIGPAYIGLEDNINSFNGVAFQETFRSFNKIGLTWKLGLKFHLTQLVHLNFELINFHHISNEIDGVKDKEFIHRIFAQISTTLSF